MGMSGSQQLCSSHCALSSLVESSQQVRSVSLNTRRIRYLLHWTTVGYARRHSFHDIRIALLHSDHLSAQALRSILANQDTSSPPILNRKGNNQVLMNLQANFMFMQAAKRARFLAFIPLRFFTALESLMAASCAGSCFLLVSLWCAKLCA